ncbi:MAG: hypothetical protein E7532_00925 [Ruminococcaceae bacterium]|nr:hypothetical protein [Oscillospiraceae bacterium]
MKKLCLILAILVLATSLFACKSENLAGTWVTTIDIYQMKLELKSDGLGTMYPPANSEGYNLSYKTEDGKLTLLYDDGTKFTYDYKLEGDTLTITFEDGTEQVYTRE